jgi:DNA topoisomerase-1
MRLRRSDPARPGIARVRRGKGWTYRWADGGVVTDPEIRRRIAELVIPPAWQEVWISPHHNGHIQAIGTDQAGRRQYLYHERWQEKRHEMKFERMLEFGAGLPRAREIVAEHLAQDGLTRERVLAAAFRMLDVGYFRIGGETYAETNGSFGLATLRRDHVKQQGDLLVFSYSAKSGLDHEEHIANPPLAQVVEKLRRRRSGPETLLAYQSGRQWHRVSSSDINRYIKDVTDLPVSAKDFRTWHGTGIAAVALAEQQTGHDPEKPWTPTSRKRAVAAAIKATSARLGNTPAVARRSYVNPKVVELFEKDRTVADAVAEARAVLPDVFEDEIALLAATPVVENAVIELLR